MNLKQLEYLCEIAKYQNLSQAARSLSLSHSTLSLCLSSLEKDLGLPLFIRNRNKLQITSEGILYVQTARKMLDLRNDLYHKLQEYKDCQELRIGLGSGYSLKIFSRILGEEKEKYSKFYVDVSEGRRPLLLRQLEKGSLDFVITAYQHMLNLPDMKSVLIRKEPFALYLSREHPLAHLASPVLTVPAQTDFSLFRRDNFILSSKETSDGSIATRILEQYCPGHRILCHINNTASIMEMVKYQMGITLMPMSCIFSTPVCHELNWCIPDEMYHRYVQLVYPKDHVFTALEMDLFDKFKEYYNADHLERYVPKD